MSKCHDKSVFLFGPRQTGKTSLLRHMLPSDTPFYDLLDRGLFLRLTANLALMREELEAEPPAAKLVVIDEIQKLPELLDEVHLLIEKHGYRFVLTGSSARKLRTKGVNLLGGRARELHIHPLTFMELGPGRFDLKRSLNRGLIPSIYFSSDPRADLAGYVGSYLDLEVSAEAAVRDLPSFSRFLAVAALCNGQLINYSSIGNDAAVKRRIVTEYFQILFDTQLAFELPAWGLGTKRKALETSKFYFFDVGVVRAILDLPPTKERSKDFGDFFEAYLAHEIKTYLDYRQPGAAFHHWRTASNHEVDFILGNETAIEAKAKTGIGSKDLKGLKACADEGILKRYLVVSLEERARMIDGRFLVLPYQEFLARLWADEWLGPREAI